MQGLALQADHGSQGDFLWRESKGSPCEWLLAASALGSSVARGNTKDFWKHQQISSEPCAWFLAVLWTGSIICLVLEEKAPVAVTGLASQGQPGAGAVMT